MFCKNCGAELKLGVNYCSKCGNRVASEKSVPDSQHYDREAEKQSAIELKKQQEHEEQLLHDIEVLEEEIENLLKEAEKQDDTIEASINRNGTDSDEDNQIQYCPYCGFFVGDHTFCGHCGKRIRG